mgnify:CR=1 FL=1
MNNLVVDSKLSTIIIDDKDTHAAAAVVEGLREAAEQIALVKNRNALLNITSLGHGDDTTALVDVKHAVLLEDGAEHVLHNDGRSRVRDEAGLLMELLGEEVNTKIAVLARLGRGGDADDLARAALEDQEIANTDVVAWDGDGVWSHDASMVTDRRGSRSRGVDSWEGWGSVSLLYNNLLAVVVMMVAASVDRVQNTIGSLVQTVTERVVVTVFVEIAHITLELLWGIYGCSRFYSNFLCRLSVTLLREVLSGLTVACLTVLGSVGGVAGLTGVLSRLTVGRLGALTIVPFGYVDLGLGVLGGRAVNGTKLAVVDTLLSRSKVSAVGLVLDVDLSFSVPTVRLLIAKVKKRLSVVLPNKDGMKGNHERWERKGRVLLGRQEKEALEQASLALV